MNNDEAMAAIVAQRRHLSTAIDALNRYVRESDDWKTTSATRQMAEVKRLVSAGGADIATWDGKPAPPPEEV